MHTQAPEEAKEWSSRGCCCCPWLSSEDRGCWHLHGEVWVHVGAGWPPGCNGYTQPLQVMGHYKLPLLCLFYWMKTSMFTIWTFSLLFLLFHYWKLKINVTVGYVILIWSCPAELTGQSSVQANTVLNNSMIISTFLCLCLLSKNKMSEVHLDIYKGQKTFFLSLMKSWTVTKQTQPQSVRSTQSCCCCRLSCSGNIIAYYNR